MTRDRVVVVGGGLAGITAAVRLAEAGRAVTLLESRPWLGGRAHSFVRGGLRVDNGQHVILRCYRAYRDLLSRLGVSQLVPIQARLDIPVLLPGTGLTRVRRGRHGPAPLNLLPGLVGYRGLRPRERAAVARAALALRRVDPDDARNDGRTFGSWLAQQAQPDTAVRRLWGLLIVPALNISTSEASLALAARVLRTGVLDEVSAGDVGVPAASLSQLHDEPARAVLAGLGVEVVTGSRVTEIASRPGGFVVAAQPRGRGSCVASGCTQVVLAVPHAVARRLVPEAAAPGSRGWVGLGESAIVNAHFLFDEQVTDLPFLAAPESAAQWVFDRSAVSDLAPGRYLVTSVSAAGRLADEPAAGLLRDQLAAVRSLLPAARDAEVVDAFVTRDRAATFRQGAGVARLRPPAATRLPGLVLAGAWTATGWPDTMEGAVRSGHTAAEVLLEQVPGAAAAAGAGPGRVRGERVPA